jgi:hypothetical protein
VTVVQLWRWLSRTPNAKSPLAILLNEHVQRHGGPDVEKVASAAPSARACGKVLMELRLWKRELRIAALLSRNKVPLAVLKPDAATPVDGRRSTVGGRARPNYQAVLKDLSNAIREELTIEEEVAWSLFEQYGQDMRCRLDRQDFEHFLDDLTPLLEEPVRQALWKQVDSNQDGYAEFGDFIEWYWKNGGGEVAEALEERTMGHRFTKMTWLFQASPVEERWRKAGEDALSAAVYAHVQAMRRHLRFIDHKDVQELLAPLLPARTEWMLAPSATWARVLEKLGYTWPRVSSPTAVSWRGFRRGAKKVLMVMRYDCHDKVAFQALLRSAGPKAAVARYLMETYTSAEEFVAKQRAADPVVVPAGGTACPPSLWYLKLSNVDNGNGVRAFTGPVTLNQVEALVETARAHVARKGAGEEYVIQRCVPSMRLSERGHKYDLRVYVCCGTEPAHPAYVYRRFGIREAPQPWDEANLSREVQCTHGGKITPAGSAEDYAHYPVVFPRIVRAVRAVTDVLRPRWEPAKPEEESARLMVLYGMDFILDADLKPYLLEVNQVPRLSYTDPAVQEWIDAMATDFLTFLILPVFENSEAQGDWCPVAETE